MLNSLKIKTAGTVFILATILLTLAMVYTYNAAFQPNIKNIEITKKIILKILNQLAEAALVSKNYNAVQLGIDNIMGEPFIDNAHLLDSRGIVVASNQLDASKLHLPSTDTAIKDNWEILKIHNGSDSLGYLYVQYSPAYLTGRKNAVLIGVLPVAVITALLMAGVSLLFVHLFTRKLNVISRMVENISRGNFNIRSRLEGKDEVSRLGQSFDHMVVWIESEQRKLLDLNKQLELRVKESTKNYKMVNKELEDFYHAVSHDLKAPLRSIDGFSLALFEDCFDALGDDGQDYVRRIKSNATHMAELIDSLLKLSRVSQNKMNIAQINLSEICKELTKRMKEKNPDRTIKFHIEPDIFVSADRQLLSTVLENLLDNAWKYTQQKVTNAVIEIGCQTKENKKICFVKDNGVGFDMKYADKLFTVFQRLHSNREYDGAGVGLSIVERIIHRHGGEIWAESTVGHGSYFFFTLGADCNKSKCE